MPDELQRVLAERKLLGGADAKIGPKPEPSSMRQLLEMLTGYPADPERDMNPMDALQMMLVGGGAAKGVGAAYRGLKNVPSATPSHAISKDPYGLSSKPSRRQFFDRASGRATQRAKDKSADLWLKSENEWANAVEYDKPNTSFDKLVEHSEQFNDKYGWPNAVNNPEAMGTWRDPNISHESGPIKSMLDDLIARIKGNQ